MRMGSGGNGYSFLPPVIRPELDKAAIPLPDKSHLIVAAEVPDAAILAAHMTIGAHLVRLAF